MFTTYDGQGSYFGQGSYLIHDDGDLWRMFQRQMMSLAVTKLLLSIASSIWRPPAKLRTWLSFNELSAYLQWRGQNCTRLVTK